MARCSFVTSRQMKKRKGLDLISVFKAAFDNVGVTMHLHLLTGAIKINSKVVSITLSEIGLHEAENKINQGNKISSRGTKSTIWYILEEGKYWRAKH